MAERVDEIGFGGYKLIQDTEGYCYGVDAVLLADFCKARPSDRVLDMCCGNGAVAVIADALYSPAEIVGIEFQAGPAELASRSAELNGISDHVSFVCADVLDIRTICDPESFDLIVCNPPYFEKGRGVECAAGSLQLARHESSAGIVEFFSAASYALKQGGRFCLIHRPERLADIFSCARSNGLEPKLLRMIVPHSGESPNLVLMQCVKGGGKGLTVLPDIAVRNGEGGFTKEIDKIYRR